MSHVVIQIVHAGIHEARALRSRSLGLALLLTIDHREIDMAKLSESLYWPQLLIQSWMLFEVEGQSEYTQVYHNKCLNVADWLYRWLHIIFPQIGVIQTFILFPVMLVHHITMKWFSPVMLCTTLAALWFQLHRNGR